ncbi:hypothetical protein Pint_27003 [Pistacia integerrima]|uniref:Uncharacterized protein n=1 Tax=Pistacia integerrima TaxID=434235 RepID=A0ACC0YQF0_9ROSI|nr:hypothetical protein Pint_27003 [Pistacia integerrima]
MIRLIKWKMMARINQPSPDQPFYNYVRRRCHYEVSKPPPNVTNSSFEDSSQEQRKGGFKQNEKQKPGTENHWHQAGLLSKIIEKQKDVLNQAGTIEDNRYAGAKMWG